MVKNLLGGNGGSVAEKPRDLFSLVWSVPVGEESQKKRVGRPLGKGLRDGVSPANEKATFLGLHGKERGGWGGQASF